MTEWMDRRHMRRPHTRMKALSTATLALMTALALAPQVALAEAPTPAPLIRQLAVGVGGLDFIEIHNPGQEDADLSELYLATVPDYYRLVLDAYSGGASDFLVQFPAGATLGAGQSAVVLVSGDDSAFMTAWGFSPDYTIPAPTATEAAPMAQPAFATAPTQPLARAGGLLVLFHWDGVADRVQDADIVSWGDGPRVDKSGQSLDGPDNDDMPTAYADETAAADQLPAPAPGEGQALIRAGGESPEAEGGNGIDGVDETSEDLSAAFVSEPASLQPLFTLTGVVRDAATDAPIPDTEIVLTGTELATVTDADGAFTLADAPPGTYRITANAAGFTPYAETIDVTADRSVEIALASQVTWSLTVTVVTSAGTAGAGAEVVVTDEVAQPVATLTADANGVARFEGLPAADYRVVGSLDGHKAMDIGPIPLQADAAVTLRLISTSRQPEVTLERTNGCTQIPSHTSTPGLSWGVLALAAAWLWVRRRP